MAYAGDSLSHKDGTLLSDEEINELAERNSKLQSERVSGEKNPMYGKHHTEESKKRMLKRIKRQLIGKIINISVHG